MLIALSILGAAFQFQAIKDLMTDKESFVASVNLGARSDLRIVCGAATDYELVVNFKPGNPLRDGYGGALIPFKNRVRFDDAPPLELEVEYYHDTIIFRDGDAQKFAVNAKASSRVVFEYTDYRGATYQFPVALDGASEAIEQVQAGCARRDKK
jgi:hypothetical protein